VYLQGKPSSQVRQAYQQVAQEKVSLVQVERVVEQNVKTTWENHIAARESLKRYLAAVKAGEIAVEGGMAEADVGAKSVVDVLVLQKDLVEAQIQLVTAQRDLVTTTYAVLQSMGSLMASTLKLNVRYYDPDAYYYEYKDAWIQFWQSEDWRYVRNEPCTPICKYPR
jgi:outer membrane protein